jgi:serine/threonine protein phosphatase PrpC
VSEQPRPLALRATVFTHQGAVRSRNEDTVAVGDWVMSRPMDQPQVLEQVVETAAVCLVADGMGGHPGGDIASRYVAECLSARCADVAGEPALSRLLYEVDHGLFALMAERPALNGMGTTVAGLHVAPSALHVFNIGDSRLYRIKDGLVQLSTDDTPGPKEADGRTAVHSTSMLTQSMGGWRDPSDVTPHILREPEVVGAYLICSDGLTDLVPVAAIAACIGADDRTSVLAMFDAAMAAGGHDNVSIILLRLRAA